MPHRLLLGAFCLCIAVAIYSVQDLMIKLLSGRYPVTEAMAFRSVVALPILTAVVHWTGGLTLLRSRRIRMVLLRAAISFGSYTAYYLAFPALSLAEAVALFFVAPLFITALAWPMLGERPDWRTILALGVGLCGTLVVLRPGFGVFEWAAALSLGAAALYGTQLIARKIGETESAPVLAFYQNIAFLIGAPALTLAFHAAGLQHAEHPSLQFLVRPWVWPTLWDALLMASCGVIASFGMMLLSQAYRLAPANQVAFFEYTAILWAPLWGFLVFSEVPRPTTLGGAALIVGAGIFALASRRKTR